MIRAVLLGACLFAWMVSAWDVRAVEAVVYLSPDQALALAFPGAAEIRTQALELTPEMRTRIQGVAKTPLNVSRMKVSIGMSDGVPTGYAMIHNVKGKARPITFMVVIDPQGRVQRVEILAYRESHGGEVRYPAFLRQFTGKTLKDPIRNKRDIRNISGATISCRAVADGVRTLLALWEEVYSLRGVALPKGEVEKGKGVGTQKKFIDPSDLSTGVHGEAAP